MCVCVGVCVKMMNGNVADAYYKLTFENTHTKTWAQVNCEESMWAWRKLVWKSSSSMRRKHAIHHGCNVHVCLKVLFTLWFLGGFCCCCRGFLHRSVLGWVLIESCLRCVLNRHRKENLGVFYLLSRTPCISKWSRTQVCTCNIMWEQLQCLQRLANTESLLSLRLSYPAWLRLEFVLWILCSI